MRLAARVLSLACLLALLTSGLGLVGGAVAAEEERIFGADELQTRLVDHTFLSGGGEGENKWRVAKSGFI